MFRYMLGGGDIQSYIIGLLLSLPIVLLALSVHEWAHGFAADRLGDPTAASPSIRCATSAPTASPA